MHRKVGSSRKETIFVTNAELLTAASNDLPTDQSKSFFNKQQAIVYNV